MQAVRKALIPVAGLGTRVLPASKAIPKEMLPVVDKPAIQYVVEEAVSAGIKQVVLITRSGKEAIENHFDAHFELESVLAQKGKTRTLESVTDMVPEDVEIVSVRQDQPRGLGHAVLCARHFCEDEPFALLLPDVLLFAQGDSDLRRMMGHYLRSGAGQVMVETVPAERVQQYGIADCGSAPPDAHASAPIAALVEKPPPARAPSNLAVVGRYILPPQVMPILQRTQPGTDNEIQLTDALAALLSDQPLHAYRMGGCSFDCGSKLGYLLANLYVGLRHSETAAGLKAALTSMQNSSLQCTD
ncbi:MAG: UTP--glucose-1-phosphate uridylyltransferase [Cellvibrionales bacterium]|nr:UTP--glucose-1-phosphate uridylyltransferase [Cellvibrionales bacterium]